MILVQRLDLGTTWSGLSVILVCYLIVIQQLVTTVGLKEMMRLVKCKNIKEGQDYSSEEDRRDV